MRMRTSNGGYGRTSGNWNRQQADIAIVDCQQRKKQGERRRMTRKWKWKKKRDNSVTQNAQQVIKLQC